MTVSHTIRTKLRPATVWPIIIALIVVAALLTPRDADPTNFKMTSYSAGQFGTRGMYDVLTSLGWQTSRWQHPFTAPLDTNAVYVLLPPAVPMSDDEDSALVRMVRAGGRLIIAIQDSSFTEQFAMWSTIDTVDDRTLSAASVAGDPTRSVFRQSTRERQFLLNGMLGAYVAFRAPVRDSTAVFMWRSAQQRDSATARPTIAGRRVGRGRVVLVANPFLITNDVFRQGTPAMAIERALEWLDPPNRRVLFDEYHQGNGIGLQGNVIVAALTDTPVGRVTLQVVLASLVLLIAIGVRAILPIPQIVFQRRSPLEHVDALARAYEQIHATRLGAQRLLRGIRRRHPMGVGGSGRTEDAVYLDAVRARYRIAPADMNALSAALRGQVSDPEFLNAGQAAGRIEHAITTQ